MEKKLLLPQLVRSAEVLLHNHKPLRIWPFIKSLLVVMHVPSPEATDHHSFTAVNR